MFRKPVIVAIFILQAGWSTVQAFGFCFNLGGNANRADFYNNNRPPPAVGFGPGIYNYPYSPVAPMPLYRPYYPRRLPVEFYRDRASGPVEGK